MRIRVVGAVCALVLLGVATGCSRKLSPPSYSSGSAVPCHAGEGSGTSGRASGSIQVLATPSLDPAFTELIHDFINTHPVTVQATFNPSPQQVAQVNNRAPADVLATDDQGSINPAVAAKSVDAPATFACNRLEIITAKGNPKHITSLADLNRSDVRLVLCAKGVPCGDLATVAFGKAGVVPKPAGYQPDVEQVVSEVETGAADAGIVFVNDARAAGDKATGVPIPPVDNVVASDSIALVRDSSNRLVARAFIAYVLSSKGQRVLAKYGFSSS